MRRASVVLALIALTSFPVSAQQNPDTAGGFESGKVYQFGELDSVNLFNGNVTVVLPIGGTYPVNGNLSHGLTLSYNANLWRHVSYKWWKSKDEQVTSQIARLRETNAGPGWRLGLGELQATGYKENDGTQWVYLSPDGGSHAFYDTLHACVEQPASPCETNDPNTQYSRDGSYLRLVRVNDLVYDLESPDGSTRRFVRSLTSSTDPFRLQWIEDAFGNRVTVVDLLTYTVLSDPHRSQTIYWRMLENDVYEPGESWRVVDRVELAAFGGQTATYTFNYTAAFIQESSYDTFEGTTPQRLVHLLSSITLPDGSQWKMDHYTQRSEFLGSELSAAQNQPGALKRLTLPTLGSYEWTYQDYEFPARGVLGKQGGMTVSLVQSAGVKTKRVLGFNMLCETHDGVGCEWRYTPVQFYGAQPYRQTTVRYPSGDESVFYFDTKPRPQTDFTGWEYGLPLVKTVSDGQGRYLSERIYDGTVASGILLREVYVAYERDPITRTGNQVLPHYWENTNRRELSRKTVYKDDGNRHKTTTMSDFDGLGHYRQVQRSSSITGGATRVETTDYNSGRGSYTVNLAANSVSGNFQHWSTSSPWVLGTFAEVTRSEAGDTEIQRFCFDAATGFLKRQRTLEGSALGTHDLISEWTTDANGNVSVGNFHGGDADSVTTSASWCAVTLGTAPYRQVFSYQNGVRRTSQWIGVPHLDLDLTIDAATGLPSESRDISGIKTTYLYDSSGRITSARPETGHGARTDYLWTRALSASSSAKVEIRVKNNAGTVTLARSEQQWDALGRPFRQLNLGADGIWSSVITVSDSMGRRYAVSEREAGFPQHYTFFRDYDPFGRPTRVEPPDNANHRMLFFYTGERITQREVLVCGQAGGCSSADQETKYQLQERYDQHGRLYEVVEPSGAGGANTTTRYAYDVGNRLREVRTIGATQIRSFDYDPRGFLTHECHPEKGAAGNGCVTYDDYDALGNVGRKIDPPFDLLYSYDAAGRMRQMDERYFVPAINDFDIRPIKVFTYANANAGVDRRLGKLQTAQRFNYVNLNGSPFTVEVRETYAYAGKGGAVSSRDTAFFVNSTPRESFTQGLTWTDLGDPETTDYPRCTHAECAPVASPKVQSFFYQNGFLTSVPGYATSLTYHPNGMIHQVFRTNGVTDTLTVDPAGMRRPRSISTSGATGGDWNSGIYRYDGAGNIHRIGGSTFAYDGVSRLVAATVDLSDGGNCTGDLTLSNQTLTGLQSFESCASLLAGPSLTVAGGADVSFTAADQVVIRDGFEVRSSAHFEAGTDPSLFGSGAGGGATTSRTYSYDLYGNLTAIAGDGGRAIPVNAVTNRLTNAAYDASGNVVEWPTAPGVQGRTFKYDAAGMMWGQSRPNANDPDGQEEWLYFYTVDDEKVWSYHGSGSDWTLRDLGGRVLRHYRQVATTWSVERNYVYAEGRLLAATKPGVTTYHFHLDHLGSPRLITDANGNRLAFHVYYPYGEEATATAQDTETMKFTGHERVFAVEWGANPAADDLDYMHARWCSPVTGRFMSLDPIRGNPGRPQSFNQYAYVLGNPVNYIDPFGLNAGDPDQPFGEEITVCANAETGMACEKPEERIMDQASFLSFLLGSHSGGGARRGALDIGLPGMSVREYAALAGGTGECDWTCQVMAQVVGDSKQGVDALEWYVTQVSLGWLLSAEGVVSISYRGIQASNGARVTGFTRHAIQRVIGNGAERAGTRPQAILNALKNPLRIVEGVDDLGRPYQVFHGAEARVVINPRTGNVVSVNPLSAAGAH